MPGSEPTFAVIGGGMLGLTLALRLAQRGQRVSLFEAAPSLGGLTISNLRGDISWDRFYHVIEAQDAHLLGLLEELDLVGDLEWQTTNTNFYDGQQLYPLNNVMDYVRWPALSFLDKARLGLNIVYGAQVKNGLALEQLSAEEWLVRWSGRRTFEKLWRPLLRSKLGNNFEYASAAFIWAIIHRFYGARQGSRRTELFGYVRGGYAHIIDALKARLLELGVCVKTGQAVTRIAKSGERFAVSTSAGSEDFGRVVVTLPSPVAMRICVGLENAEIEQHNALRYQGVVCPSILMRQPLGGAYLTYITDDSIPFTTVIEMSSLVDRKMFGGLHLAYLPKYVPSDDALLNAPDDEIEALLLPGLIRMFPHLRADEIVEIRVARARHVTAIATRNYSARLPPVRTGVRGLYICNSAQIINASLSVNETVDLANRSTDGLLQ